MSVTFDYSTRHIDRDFSFVKGGEICSLRGVNASVGGHACKTCPFYEKSVTPGSFGGRFFPITDWDEEYVLCKNNKASDSKNSDGIRYLFYKAVEEEALRAYYD